MNELKERYPAAWQTGFLFAVDAVTNLIDYGFHVYLGRALIAADFAIVQTMNAVLLVVVTTFSVMQPVVARYVAAHRADTEDDSDPGRAIFRYYFRLAAGLGVALTAVAWLARTPLARGLNVPPAGVAVGAAMLLFALLRPVVAGMLQGQQRFVAFGLTRAAYAAGRFAVGLLLISVLGGGALAALATFPLGAALSLLLGVGLLGWAVWRPGRGLPEAVRREGWRLSLGALVAYAAYMSLLSLDLVWVNRSFPPDTAGSYATAVLLRRALALLPGAVIVILYPRVVERVAAGRLPDGLLARAAAVITLPTLVLSGAFFLLGAPLIRLTFGAQYVGAAPWLGWLGLGMVGYGLASLWMNVYLATRPGPFVATLALTALAQFLLLARYHATLTQVIAIFGGTGWALAAAGLLLYLLWLRPHLRTG